jgi:hypothetical protein
MDWGRILSEFQVVSKGIACDPSGYYCKERKSMSSWFLVFLIGAFVHTILYIVSVGNFLNWKPVLTIGYSEQLTMTSLNSDDSIPHYPYRVNALPFIVSGLDWIFMIFILFSYFFLELDGFFELYRILFTVFFLINTIWGVYLTTTKRMGAFLEGNSLVVGIIDRTTVNQLGLFAGGWSLLAMCFLVAGIGVMAGLVAL